jgi:hypothetical protein
VTGPGPFFPLPGDPAPLAIGDRTFALAPLVSQSALAANQSMEVWVVLLAGMLFVALLEGVLLVAATSRVREEVYSETGDLTWHDTIRARRPG